MKKETGIAIVCFSFLMVTLFVTLSILLNTSLSFQRGDVVVLKQTSRLVYDWNAPELDKPGCYPAEGSRFKIVGFSSINHGSFIEPSNIAWLESINIEEEPCEGWANIANLKKINLDYKIIKKYK